ncbi:MAG TPA: TolC family protein [Gemmata sp.]|nr:TolC family protein [Gemmata sp.]
MRRRFCLIVPLAALIGWGCHTPPAYESAPLPRFLLDPASPQLPSPEEPPEVPIARRPVVTLPDAIQECVLNSLRLKVGVEHLRLAQADYVTESLIPNCQFLADAQLLPLSSINLVNQGGPPQYDAYLAVPVDWLLFGKRVAAQAAARLNVDVAQAEFADLLRKEVSLTVDAFYDALEADVAVGLADQTVQALLSLEKLARERGKADEASTLESRRVRLAVLDAQRELRKRRAAAETTKAKLQARIGRPPDTPDFVVRGTLDVRAVAPPMSVTRAWAIAEQNRPDLVAARRAISTAEAAIARERRRAHPQVALTAGVDYQDQVRITGFRNPWLWTVAATATLPLTDRNQGRIMAAEAVARSARAALGVAIADARAEVEQAVAEYTEAVNGVTGEDIPSLQNARLVREETLTRYRKGTKDIVDALDAERAYRDRLRNTLGNLTDYWQALNHLNAAVGLRVLSAEVAEKDSLLEKGKELGPPRN